VATCAKIPFPNQHVARAIARKVRRRNEARGLWVPKGIHWCSCCKAWHLTSKRQSGTPWWEKRARPV